MQDITIEDLKKRLEQDRDFLFIDVREQWEYNEFNLGADLIPLSTLPDHMEELQTQKDEEIIIHCKSGGRSGQAKEFLKQFGFSNVRNVLGGVVRWQELYGK